MQTLLHKIQEMQGGLTPAQRSIANYLVSGYASIPFQTISQIAELTGVSETSIFLFCKELGFSGFSDLKRFIADYINNSLPLNNRLACTAANTTEMDAVSEIVRCDVENIQATMSNPENLKNLPKLLDMIDRAGRIYTFGGRSSSFFSSLLAFKLRQQDLQITNIDLGVGDFIDRMMMIRPGDLAIVFSFPRYTKMVVQMVKDLHSRGVPVVLVTCEALSPCYEYASLVFSCRTASTSYVASFSACLTLINSIIMARALRHKDHVEDWLEALEKNLFDYDMFC